MLQILDRLNAEARYRAETEKQALEVTKEENKLKYDFENKRLGFQAELIKNNQRVNQTVVKSLIVGGFLFFIAICTFAYLDKTQIIKDIFFPLLTAIIGALGGYGYGKYRSDKEKTQ